MSQYNGKFLKASVPATGVLLVEMNKAPVNSFHDAFWEELGSTFDAISADGDIKVVVLASSLDKIFTVGLDLNAVSEKLKPTSEDPSRHAVYMRRHLSIFQAAISSLEKCNQPVIAATHGIAMGLAVDIIAACDIRYCATDVRFSIKEVDVGLAADIGSLARLPKITANESLLRELALTARDFDAREADKLGLVSKVVEGGRQEVLAAALDLAKTIASKSPIAVLGTKHIMLHARDHTVQENLDYTATWNQVMLQSDDLKQSIKAFMTKTPAQYKPMPKL